MKILAIETSCDETAIAIISVNDKNIGSNNNQEFFDNLQSKILANILHSQIKLHSSFGGVVPELAARSHLAIIDDLILQALKQANLNLSDIDLFTATCGPGLIGGLIVGMMAAKSLAIFHNKPFLAVNHLEGHSLTARFTHNIYFPYLLLLISGGHCQIILVKNVGDYEIIGATIDDALGEAFDKVAKMLNLGYPGGPQIEKMSKIGNDNRISLPKPLIEDRQHLYNFSFSGLKTAVLRNIEKIKMSSINNQLNNQDIADISASFQKTVTEILINRLNNSLNHHNIKDLIASKKLDKVVIAGGVASNQYIFKKISDFLINHNLQLIAPPINLCTDNAVMIGWSAIENLFCGNKERLQKMQDLNFKPRSNWPLNEK